MHIRLSEYKSIVTIVLEVRKIIFGWDLKLLESELYVPELERWKEMK